MTATGYRRLAEVMKTARPALKDAWVAAFRQSTVRWPGNVQAEEIGSVIEHLFASLTMVLTAEGAEPTGLVAGSAALREVEQAAAFLGGNLASGKRSGFDVAALLLSLRDTLVPLADGAARDELGRYIEWLAVVAVDSFGAARARAVDEGYRELLMEGTPLVLIVPELPAILLVGATDANVIDSLLSRLLLTVVRVGARAVVIDVAGVADPATDWLLERLSRFFTHRKVIAQTEALVVGLPAEAESAWRDLTTQIRFFDHFDGAVAEGLRVAGYRLVRTPTTGH